MNSNVENSVEERIISLVHNEQEFPVPNLSDGEEEHGGIKREPTDALGVGLRLRGKQAFLNEVETKIVALATKEIPGVYEMGKLGLDHVLRGVAQRAVKTGESAR